MKKNWLAACILGAVSAVLYFASMVDYAFPGVSAHLQALWRGLDTASTPPYPLMAFFAKLFGAGNALAPVCGALSVVLVFAFTGMFVYRRINCEGSETKRDGISLVASIAAAVVFMLTPAVREASSRLEPRMFDFCWMMLSLLPVALMVFAPKKTVLLLPVVSGFMAALGACDSALFFAAIPLFVLAIVAAQRSRGVRPYVAVVLFVFSWLVAFPSCASGFGLEMSDLLKELFKEFKLFLLCKKLCLCVAVRRNFHTAFFKNTDN
jgi:hypothetical protein